MHKAERKTKQLLLCQFEWWLANSDTIKQYYAPQNAVVLKIQVKRAASAEWLWWKRWNISNLLCTACVVYHLFMTPVHIYWHCVEALFIKLWSIWDFYILMLLRLWDVENGCDMDMCTLQVWHLCEYSSNNFQWIVLCLMHLLLAVWHRKRRGPAKLHRRSTFGSS